jgi:hypothetical protein
MGADVTVSCEGDCEVIEQLGEKQDFETELTRLGYRHEDFTLHVLRSTARGKPADWSQDYSVTVTAVASGKAGVYDGGPTHDWVRQCASDLCRGVLGRPQGR